MSEICVVVIPYYQREPGILRAAVASVLRQAPPQETRVRIVVVDDASPHPADADLGGLAVAAPFELAILRKANGGAGSARNHGLESLDPETVRYVAFLDSDDTWEGPHVSEAIGAIRDGADFAFANSWHDAVTSFSYFAYMRARHALDPGAHPVCRTVSGREAFGAFLAECIPHTSNVVYDFARHPATRFHEGLRRTGEDHLFWLDLAASSRIVAYTTAVRGRRGSGVSIYREALAWDSPHVLDRLVDGLVFRTIVERRFSLRGGEQLIQEVATREAYDHFAFLWARNLPRRPRAAVRAITRLLAEAPSCRKRLPGAFRRLPAHRRRLRRDATLAVSREDVGAS